MNRSPKRNICEVPSTRVRSLLDLCLRLAFRLPLSAHPILEEAEWYEVFLRTVKPDPHIDTDNDNGKRYRCLVPGCGKMYWRRYRVVGHMRLRHSSEGEPGYQCSTCFNSYCELEELKNHHRAEAHQGCTLIFTQEPTGNAEGNVPDESTRYRCSADGCSKTYSSRYSCSAHITACHASSTEKQYRCFFPGCMKAYSRKDSLIRHRRAAGHSSDVTEVSDPESEGGRRQEDCRDRVQELADLFDEI